MSVLSFGGQEMKIVLPYYGDMSTDVAIELAALRNEEHARDMALAAARQAKIAKHNNREAPLMTHGQLVAQVDEAVFADWERREGKGFFADKSSRRGFLKRFPECAVKGVSRNPSIIVPDKSGIASPRRGGRWAT